MPIFEGTDPDGWLHRAEQYFSVNRFVELEKLQAGVCMDGEALAWHQWEESLQPFRSRDELKKELIARFRNTQEGTPRDRFFALRQETTVRDFRRRFEVLARNISDVSLASMESVFVNGLKDEYRVEIRVLQTIGLKDTMDLAQRLEHKRIRLFKNSGPSPITFPCANSGGWNFQGINVSNAQRNQGEEKVFRVPEKKEGRRLSDAEQQWRRERGLCFMCDEKFHVGHKCKKKELQVLLAQIEEDEGTMMFRGKLKQMGFLLEKILNQEIPKNTR